MKEYKNNDERIASEASLYSITCNISNRIYIVKTSRIIKKCIYESLLDLELGDFRQT